MEQMMGHKVQQATITLARVDANLMATGQELLYEYLEFLSNAIDDSREAREQYEKFKQELDNNTVYQIVLGTETEAPIDKVDFEKKLKQEGIVVIGGDKERECIVVEADGTERQSRGYVYMVAKTDLEDIYRIRDELMHEQPNKMTLKLVKLEGIEATLIKKHLEEQDVSCKVYENRNNEYNLLYSKENRKELDYAKLITAIELSGIDGQAVRKQYEYRMEQSVNAEINIFDRNQKETFYLINHESTLEVNKKSVTYSRPGHEPLVIPKIEENRGAICGCFREMGTFLTVNRTEYQEFAKFASGEERYKHIQEWMRQQKVPQFSHEELLAAFEKKAHLQEIVHHIDNEVVVKDNTTLAACEDVYMTGWQKPEEMNYDSYKNEHIISIAEESMTTYYALEDKDKTQTIDSLVRETIEESLREHSTQNILQNLEQKKKDLIKEQNAMTPEELKMQAEELKRMNQEFNDLWGQVTMMPDEANEENIVDGNKW